MLKAELLSSVARLPVLGPLLRRLARRYPEGSIVAIRSGPAAGLLWRRHRRFINAYWAGTYELPVQKALARTLRPGATFFDVGASAGFFTVLGARLVGERGKVVAIEPFPANAAVVREQFALNGFDARAVVEEVALTDVEGEARFLVPEHGSGKLLPVDTQATTIATKTTTLDALCRRHGQPDVVKMDVEGAEGAALRGGSELLRDGHATFIVELHGEEAPRQVQSILSQHGYTLYDLDGRPAEPAKLPARILAVKRSAQ